MASIIAHPGKQSDNFRTLCHINDPKKRRGYASVAVARSGQPRSFSYAVVEPAHRNRKTSELDDVFAADEHIKYESSFAHRFIPTDEAPEPSVFYGQYTPFAFGKFRHGLTRSAQEAHYCLIAQNGAGSPASFIAYSLSVANQSAEHPDKKSTQLDMQVCLEQLYTRKRYRAKGAASALLQHLCDSVEIELRHLLSQPSATPVNNVTVYLSTPEQPSTATALLVRRLAIAGVLERLESLRSTYPGLQVSLGGTDATASNDSLKRNDPLQMQANAA